MRSLTGRRSIAQMAIELIVMIISISAISVETLRVQDMVYILNEILSKGIKNKTNLTAEKIIKGREKSKIK